MPHVNVDILFKTGEKSNKIHDTHTHMIHTHTHIHLKSRLMRTWEFAWLSVLFSAHNRHSIQNRYNYHRQLDSLDFFAFLSAMPNSFPFQGRHFLPSPSPQFLHSFNAVFWNDFCSVYRNASCYYVTKVTDLRLLALEGSACKAHLSLAKLSYKG